MAMSYTAQGGYIILHDIPSKLLNVDICEDTILVYTYIYNTRIGIISTSKNHL